MPFEYSPPKKSTLLISFVLLALGMVIGFLGALEMIFPFLSQIEVLAAWDIDAVFVITGLILAGLSWFLVYLGVKLRGV